LGTKFPRKGLATAFKKGAKSIKSSIIKREDGGLSQAVFGTCHNSCKRQIRAASGGSRMYHGRGGRECTGQSRGGGGERTEKRKKKCIEHPFLWVYRPFPSF